MPTLTQPGDVEIFEKADAVFVTEVTGKPEPSVEWFHGFTKLRHGKTASVETDMGRHTVHTVTMEGCKIEDTGTIRMVASNKAGQVEAESSLVVNGRRI